MKRENLSFDNQVVKANSMIQGRYKMSALEQKIVLTLCSKIKSDDDMFLDFTMTVDEFANFLNIENDNFQFNNELKKKCKILNNRDIEMNIGTKENPDWLFFHWFEYIRYIPKQAKIQMKFSPMLEPYLLNLKEKYTKYKIGYVLNFKSEFSFRMYELMKAYEKIGERTFTIDELRELLVLNQNQYIKYSHLKTRVIQKAIDEINKYSDIKVEIIKEEKEGKKFVGITFSINQNEYRKPIDELLEYEQFKSKTKKELQQILSNYIETRYKTALDNAKTDLFSKETIIELIFELKQGYYENYLIKYPIPYFTKILQEKERKISGKSISNTELRRYEIQKLME